MLVEVLPKSARAKNRVNAHGTVMKLLETRPGQFRVESLEKTFSLSSELKTVWNGWFTFDEANFKQVESN